MPIHIVYIPELASLLELPIEVVESTIITGLVPTIDIDGEEAVDLRELPPSLAEMLVARQLDRKAAADGTEEDEPDDDMDDEEDGGTEDDGTADDDTAHDGEDNSDDEDGGDEGGDDDSGEDDDDGDDDGDEVEP